MKKLLTLLLLATLLLTACVSPPIDNATTTASTGEESTTPADNDTPLPDDTDTTVPDDTDTTVPDDTDTSIPNDTDTTVLDDTETTSNEEFDTTLEFEPDIDLTQTAIWHSNWEGFSQNLIDSDIEIDSIKGKIMTYPIMEFDDYETRSIGYFEEIARNERQEIEKDFFWNFQVYWKHKEDRARNMDHTLFYCPEGYSIEHILCQFAILDPLNDIYITGTQGKASYYCLINEKMYMSFHVNTDCEDFESICKQFIDYALEIKKIANMEEAQ